MCNSTNTFEEIRLSDIPCQCHCGILPLSYQGSVNLLPEWWSAHGFGSPAIRVMQSLVIRYHNRARWPTIFTISVKIDQEVQMDR
jgi:hypothetical protein